MSGKIMLGDILKSPGFRKYFANTSWMMSENFIRMAVNFAVGIFIARHLGPDGYGLLSYGLSVVALFGILSSLGMDEIIVRNLVQDSRRKESVLGTAFALRLAGAIFIAILAPFFSYLVNPDRQSLLMVLILAFGPLFQSSRIINLFFHSQVQAKYSSIALGISFGLSTLIKIIFLFSKANVFLFAGAYLFEYVAMAAAFTGIYEKRGHRILQWVFEKREAMALLRDSLPIIFSGILMAVYSRIDQVMIKSMIGNDAVGNYAVAVTLTEAWHVIPYVLTASVFPAIVKARNDNEAVFRERMSQIYSLLLWTALAIALPVSLTSDWIIRILFGPAYEHSGPVLAIMIWNCVFIFLQLANGKWIIAENNQKIWLWISPAGCLINIVMNLVLISRYGIQGAAMATLLAQFFTSHLAFAFTRGTSSICMLQWKAFFRPFLFVKSLF